ncbi:serine carboxypeptidase-like 17 [Typha latifolia]|uniref:serine carboxypeptidase-like 17 n=1 Tax=Typha latifolia TaxID=4733 RepID=UPI003C2FA88E
MPRSWYWIRLDSPVGTGFSFSASPEGYYVGDLSSSMQVHSFIIKWFIDHPQFLSNPFYVSGDSYAGKLVPLIAQIISEGTNYGKHLVLNLKGYLIGNPATGEKIDKISRVPYAHGVGIISDQIYEFVQRHCAGEDYEHPRNVLCATMLDTVDEISHILEPKCPTSYVHLLSYWWANSKSTQEALHVNKGTVREWQRCNDDLPYTKDRSSSIKHHLNLTSRGYRALVYSGDHDLVVPFLGTQEWVRSLNFSIVSDWRSWNFGGQSAGFTITYSNNMTFATVKGAGHTAPEYRPKECLAMIRRWLSIKPL